MIAFLLKYRTYLTGFLVGAALSGCLGNLSHDADLARIQVERAEEVSATASAYADQVRQVQANLARTQDQLIALDAAKTGELTHARSENDRLRILYSAADDDRKRLRVAVKRASNTGSVSPDTCTGPMGNATTVELSDAAGSAVWHLRQSLIDNEAKIAYLQGYICTIRPDPVLCILLEPLTGE